VDPEEKTEGQLSHREHAQGKVHGGVAVITNILGGHHTGGDVIEEADTKKAPRLLGQHMGAESPGDVFADESSDVAGAGGNRDRAQGRVVEEVEAALLEQSRVGRSPKRGQGQGRDGNRGRAVTRVQSRGEAREAGAVRSENVGVVVRLGAVGSWEGRELQRVGRSAVGEGRVAGAWYGQGWEAGAKGLLRVVRPRESKPRRASRELKWVPSA
jgi:hypothetical protein